MTKNKGITLIALIITIIVMLILVSVSITMAVNGGLFNYAERAVKETKKKASEELTLSEGKFAIADSSTSEGQTASGETWYNSIDDYIKGGEGFSEIYEKSKIYEDKNGVKAPIPAGFAVGKTEGINTIADGLVIQDSEGNQFVWIPVASSMPSVTHTENAATDPTGKYDEMKASVEGNHGFYIGRYEAGTTEERKSTTTTYPKAYVKRDLYPYNFVKWGTDLNTVGTEGAVYLSIQMYRGSSSVVSTLCYGSQWDAMLTFVEDGNHPIEVSSASWGNYQNSDTFIVSRGKYAEVNSSFQLDEFKDAINYEKKSGKAVLLTTGATDRNKAKNIYDIAGNLGEWTMEFNTPSLTYITRAQRGQTFRAPTSWAKFGLDGSNSSSMTIGFRPALYIIGQVAEAN